MGSFGEFWSKVKEKFAGEDVDGFVDDGYDNVNYPEDEPTGYEEIARPKSGFGNIKKMDNYYSSRPSLSFVSKSVESKENARIDSSNMALFLPKSSADTNNIADAIKEGKIVVLNILDSPITDEQSQRMCDYLIGVCYAVGAKVEAITDNILLMTPKDCKVSTEDKKALRRSGMRLVSGFDR